MRKISSLLGNHPAIADSGGEKSGPRRRLALVAREARPAQHAGAGRAIDRLRRGQDPRRRDGRHQAAGRLRPVADDAVPQEFRDADVSTRSQFQRRALGPRVPLGPGGVREPDELGDCRRRRPSAQAGSAGPSTNTTVASPDAHLSRDGAGDHAERPRRQLDRPPEQPDRPRARRRSPTASRAQDQPVRARLEPTVYLDELKDYQDHLNEIRRINMGDDIADSAGYGLYLIRMPVSIQPGECTRQGPRRRPHRHRPPRFRPRLPPHHLPQPGHQRPRRSARAGRLRDRSARGRCRQRHAGASADSWQDLATAIRRQSTRHRPQRATAGAVGTRINSRRTIERSRSAALDRSSCTRINDRELIPSPRPNATTSSSSKTSYDPARSREASDRRRHAPGHDVRGPSSAATRRRPTTSSPRSTTATTRIPRTKIRSLRRPTVESIAGHVRNSRISPSSDRRLPASSPRCFPGVFQYTDRPAAYPDMPLHRPNHSLTGDHPQLRHRGRDRAAQRPAPGGHEAGLRQGRGRLRRRSTRCDSSPPARPRGRGAVPGVRRRSAGRSSPSPSTRSSTSRTSPTPAASSATSSSPWPSPSPPGRSTSTSSRQFQRRIEIDAETIALNRTVTSFAHGNDTFGFRFTPRYQNPPPERSTSRSSPTS